ncbi:UNVERIFIED_ORG: hypothetical protein LHK14_00540 [Roseateles sp. XES5]|nr:hypothetical protein [Roseateles sp. XES5]
MATIQSLHSSVQLAGLEHNFVRHRVGGFPAGFEVATHPFNDANPSVSIADADPAKPSSAPHLGSGGAIATLPYGGVQLLGRASVPAPAGRTVDLTAGWTVWAALTIKPGTGVWTVFQDYGFSTNQRGFWVFAQQEAGGASGDQIPLIVRMTNDGANDFSAAFNLQAPANSKWAFGKPMLIAVTHDGFDNIGVDIFASNGLVSSAVKEMDVAKGTGPIGFKSPDTRWQVGGIDVPSPGIEVEAWGVLARKWTRSDGLLAYKAARELAFSRTRRWT